MPIFVPDMVTERGRADAKRHREKQRDVLKESLPKIIAEESIITSKKGKKVRIPIKSIEIPYFRPGKGGKGVGIGQGSGKTGDVIGRRPGQGKGGQAGTAPGEDYLESEVELEELIELMIEDLGLPRLDERSVKEFVVEIGWKIHGHTTTGPWVLLDRRLTKREGMRRFWFLLRKLEDATGLDEITCFDALARTGGIMEEALKLLHDPTFRPEAKEIKPFPIFELDDFRFHKIVPDIKEQSRAVIMAMMDVSGSMSTMKKYLARSMLFWLAAFLRKIYEEVEIRFVIHHTEARIVDEDSFFKTGESGGTYCWKAYELAGMLIDTEYPLSQWNVYVWHFSDGEDYDTAKTVSEVKKLFARKVNMVGYGEIKPAEEYGMGAGINSDLMRAFRNAFMVQEVSDTTHGFNFCSGQKEPFLGVMITRKEHLLLALKEFLKKDRWAEVKA